MRTGNKKATAFTLVELLVVVAILAILMGLLVPTLAKMRTQARVSATRTVIHAIEGGLGLYYSDHKVYPLSGPSGSVAGGSGAANLVWCLTGYGKGFQLVYRGEFYGPYAGTEKLKVDSNKIFVDAWNQPILYYAFDSTPTRGLSPGAKYYTEDNSGVTPAPADADAYAQDAGNYLDRRYLLLSPGPDGSYRDRATAARSDDVTNLRSE